MLRNLVEAFSFACMYVSFFKVAWDPFYTSTKKSDHKFSENNNKLDESRIRSKAGTVGDKRPEDFQ